MKGLRLTAAALLAGWAVIGQAEISNDEVRVALLDDLSGIYADLSGQGAVIAAEMAMDDIKAEGFPYDIELIVRDHESNGDIAKRQANKLVEEQNVDAFAGLVSSSTAIPVQQIGKENNVAVLHSGAASTSLTGKNCSPTGVHWAYDTYSLAVGTARAVVREGGESWFFVTADYAFGHNLEDETARIVEQEGGQVVGSAAHPFKGSDFSQYLLEAQASGAEVIAMANAGGDTRTTVRQAYEFGILQGDQDLVALLMFLPDIRSLGLYVAGGLKLTTGFYWNFDDKTREWSRRFKERHGAMPTMIQASVYSSLMHYFRGVWESGTDDAKKAVAQMREMPVNDFFARNGKIRRDGRMVHDMYLVEVKRPSESAEAWDYFKVLRVIPGEEAFKPLEQSECPLL